jgi:hypothetical protein
MQAGWQQEMANSSSNVVREGDEGLQRRVKEYFVCKGGGARLVLYYMPDRGADQKKKGPGEIQPESRRRDDDA